MDTQIQITPEQIIQELEERIITQMTLHHIQIHNRDEEIARLKRELTVVYSTLRQSYVKNERAIKVCDDKIIEYGGK